MSPLTQLGLNRLGYGGGIDRDFNPIVNYIDEFDRHFSHRHRFVNCYIPRFDLEEDAHFYYLYGDIPGARVEDISIEASDNHTLVIEGQTLRAGPPQSQSQGQSQGQQYPAQEPQGSPGEGEEPFVKVNVDDHSPPAPTTHTEIAPPQNPDAITAAPSHPHHNRHPSAYPPPPTSPGGNRILLSERLVGSFHRTFGFPSAIQEEGIKASMENGVLCLVVPKREKQEVKRGRKIPVVHGNWWKGEERGSGFGFASGAV